MNEFNGEWRTSSAATSMISTNKIDWSALTEDLARRFWGEPNKTQSSENELRWGNNGARSLDRRNGKWFDHELKNGGGALALVMREVECGDREGALRWLTKEKLIPERLGEPKAIYDYVDEEGTLLFQVRRFELDGGKTFLPRVPDGCGGWREGKRCMKGVRRVLYRLPELIADVAGGRLIFNVEGERNVDWFRNAGIAATCNPFGALKWDDGQWKYGEHLRGADVIIIPDNDDVGRQHADQVAAILCGNARRVRVLDLAQHWPTPQGARKGDDAIDWFDAGGTVDQLLKLAEGAPEWEPKAQDKATELPESVKPEDFFAYMPMHNYIYVPTRQTWPAQSVNSRLGELDGKHASIWLDQNRPVEQMTWAPGMPMVIRNKLVDDAGWIDRPGTAVFNNYRPPTLVPAPGNPARWLKHLVRLYGKAGARHVVRSFAHRVQRPGEKINHALVLGGPQGIGKDTLLEPLKRAVGPWNFKEASPSQLLERWNDFLKATVLRINEAHDLGDYDRYKFYDRLKSIEAAPPDTVRIDEKFIRQYYVFNVAGVVITTNHRTDALYLPPDDRRHYVLWTETTKDNFNREYWDQLWAWYDEGGDAQVAHYLATLDLSGFNPKAPPEKTEAWWDIVNASRAPEDIEMADALEKLGWPRVVTVYDVRNVCDEEFAKWLRDRRNARVIPHRFEECGYVRVRNPAATNGVWTIRGKKSVVYAKKELTMFEAHAAIAETYRTDLPF